MYVLAVSDENDLCPIPMSQAIFKLNHLHHFYCICRFYFSAPRADCECLLIYVMYTPILTQKCCEIVSILYADNAKFVKGLSPCVKILRLHHRWSADCLRIHSYSFCPFDLEFYGRSIRFY